MARLSLRGPQAAIAHQREFFPHQYELIAAPSFETTPNWAECQQSDGFACPVAKLAGAAIQWGALAKPFGVGRLCARTCQSPFGRFASVMVHLYVAHVG
jgi:hypothetical protein